MARDKTPAQSPHRKNRGTKPANSNDPLLAGCIHSCADTQIPRLGGPNFHEIPINPPLAQVQNNRRDGMNREALHRGRVAYEPNALAGGCPFEAGAAGFVSYPDAINDNKVRGKAEKFAEHYAPLASLYSALTDEGAVVHFVGSRVGLFGGDSGETIEANKSMENALGFLFDAMILSDRQTAVQSLAAHRHFSRDSDPPTT